MISTKMLNSLFYLIPLLRLISPAAAAPAVGEQIPPAGQIRLFTEGKLVGDAALTFNIGGVPRGQTFLRFERKGPNSFLLVDYSATQRAQRDNGAVLEGLEAGEGAFSLHKRSDDKDEHLDVRGIALFQIWVLKGDWLISV